MPDTPPARRRNAAATREAILTSARRAFARAGYDGAGVRESAAGAGGTAMRGNSYVGSREQRFGEGLAATSAAPPILSRENRRSSNLPEAIAATRVDITQAADTPLEGFLIMLHSASSKRAAEIGREQIEKGHQKTLTDALGGDL